MQHSLSLHQHSGCRLQRVSASDSNGFWSDPVCFADATSPKDELEPWIWLFSVVVPARNALVCVAVALPYSPQMSIDVACHLMYQLMCLLSAGGTLQAEYSI